MELPRRAKIGVALPGRVRPVDNPIQGRIPALPNLAADQKAIEAIWKWRFEPGLKDGKPVSVAAEVKVDFRLK